MRSHWIASVAVGNEKTPSFFFRGLLEPQPSAEEEIPPNSAAQRLEESEQDQSMSANDGANEVDQCVEIEEFVPTL